MINSGTVQYYQKSYSGHLSDFIARETAKNTKIKYVVVSVIFAVILLVFGFANPLFAKTDTLDIKLTDTGQEIYLQKNFEENIKNKYGGSYVNFPADGIAHIKKIKYINSKPIKINIVELNTNVNPHLKIKPQIASKKLNSKTTIRKIANREQAIIAINGGFFKPQSGVPLGALMINKEVLTGPIYNRVGIAIFEEGNKTSFKMTNINFDIKAYTKEAMIELDNINQPRMLSSYKLLYTSSWGELSPVAPNGGLNFLIQGNKITKISTEQIQLNGDDMVISAPKNLADILKLNTEIYINLKLQDELKNATHIIGAGPYLVKDSQIYVDYKAQKLSAISGKNPRSAIGYKNDGTFIIVTVDGREKASVGMTLYELAKFMKSLDCEYAMNFDGGSSSALFVDGKIVNNAVNKEGIAVSNALLVKEYNPNEMQISSL